MQRIQKNTTVIKHTISFTQDEVKQILIREAYLKYGSALRGTRIGESELAWPIEDAEDVCFEISILVENDAS